MGKIDLDTVPERSGSIYPAPYDAMMQGRSSLRLGDAGGLTQFGVNIVVLQPGALSSLRHWHMEQDEFVMVTQGVCTLIQDAGETVLQTGDCAAFRAGDSDGHHLRNDSDTEVRFLEVGTRTPTETAFYSDIDLRVDVDETGFTFSRKDKSPYVAPETGEEK